MIEPPDFHCLYTLYTNQSGILDMEISFFFCFYQKLNEKPQLLLRKYSTRGSTSVFIHKTENTQRCASRQVARVASRLPFRNAQSLSAIIVFPKLRDPARIVVERHRNGFEHQLATLVPIAFLHQLTTIESTVGRHEIKVIRFSEEP